MPGRGRQSAALNRMSLPGEPAGRGRKAGRHRMCHPRRSVRQANDVKEPRSGARTASPCPAPDCVITCCLTDQHYRTAGLSRFIFTAAQARYSFFSSSSSRSSFTGVLAVSRNGDCCQRVRRWRSRVRERIMPIASASSIIRRRILVVLST